ncbi:MAG: hypothetical protein JSU91_02020 [Thermoplasmatales archaeon]|nr:MAG: hypothetical protein JSU91_02020 [Thermoplasmatales archaeon]
MERNQVLLYKTLAIGVIILFVGIGIKPAFANMTFESDNSELVEIIVEFYEHDKIYNHTVMLTTEQLKELETLINNINNSLDSNSKPEEIELIYKNAIESFYEYGLLPNDVSIDYVQGLVTGRQQNPKIVNFLEKWYNKNIGSSDINENFLCLISGDTINTIFAGSVPILIGLHLIFIAYRTNMYLNWLKIYTPKLWNWLSEFEYTSLLNKLLNLRLGFWLYLASGINFLPMKFGAFMLYFGLEMDDYYWLEPVPAEGWVRTIGLSGYKYWDGSFYGFVVGFTGIKIIKELFDFFYLGAALKVHIEIE